ALLKYVGNTIRKAQGESEFDNDEEIDNWFIENPISLEQVIEIMISGVVGLAHRQQGVLRPSQPRFTEDVDPLREIKKLERRLRLLVRSELKKKYVSDDKVHRRIQEHLGEHAFGECLRNMEKTRKQNPGVAFDFLDFLY